MTTPICDAFRRNPLIDPETGEKLYIGSPRWRQLSDLCRTQAFAPTTVTMPPVGGTTPTPGRVVPPTVTMPTIPTPGRVVPPTMTMPTIPTPGRVVPPTMTMPTIGGTTPTPGRMPVPTIRLDPVYGLPILPEDEILNEQNLPGIPGTAEFTQPIPARPTAPVNPGAVTPEGIEAVTELFPNHMNQYQPPRHLTILGRTLHTYRYIPGADDDEIGLVVTPHKIMVNRNVENIDVQLDFDPSQINVVAGGPAIIELRGDWIITPLDNRPDGGNGGVIARLPYRLFPRIRIGSNWEISHNNIHIPYPQPVEIDPDGYIIQDDPMIEEFQFQATDYNSEYFQATVETSRLLHPSLEIMIQAAEAINAFPELRNRNQYSSYLRDATFFEVNRIYKGPRAEAARKFMLFMDQACVPTEEIENIYKLDMTPFTAEQIEALRQFMEQRGYRWTYLGFVNINHPAGLARFTDTPLNAEILPTTITPDQAILMEAWRKRALTGLTKVTDDTLNLLGLRSIVQKTDYYNVPTLVNSGPRMNQLLAQIITFRDISYNDLRNPGEVATSTKGIDISNKSARKYGLDRKNYYMMLYHEASHRNLPRQ
jgi:hypothetical protein